MNYDEERSIIEKYFTKNFNNSEVPVEYENLESSNHNNGDRSLEEKINVTLLIRNGNAQQISMGGEKNHYRNSGFIVCEVRGPLNTGMGPMLRVSDEITDIFLAKQFDGVITRVPRPDRLGNRGGMYQINVIIPYERTILQ